MMAFFYIVAFFSAFLRVSFELKDEMREIVRAFREELLEIRLRLALSRIERYVKRGKGTSPQVRLQRPPGWLLCRFAELVFSRKVYTLVLEPTLADLQKEYFQALADGRLWKARFVLVRGYSAFWSAIAAQLPISLVKRIYKLWNASQ